jgi:surface antigen
MAGFFLEAKSINENPNLTSDQKQEARKVLSDRIKGVAATKATSEMQDLMFYKQLLSKDPSLAEAFANKKGYTEDQKSSIKASVASAPAPHTSSVGISSSMVGSTYQINVPQGYDTSTSRVTGKEGKQCGEYVNDVTGVGVGNTLKSKTDLIDHHDPRVGDVFVQNIGPYGHVGIVTAINEDGTLQTSEFNRSGTDQERSDQASLDPSKIVGYIKNPYSKSAIDRANTNLDIGRILKSLSGSQVTDKERETMTNSVNAYINSGLTVDDALKRVIGYNISPEADKSYADFIYNRLSSLSKPPEGLNMSSFSSNLNNGNKLAAIRDLEKRIYKDSNDGVLLSNASRVEEKIEEARKLIDRGIAAVGAVEGSVAEWMGKFSSPETNALKTALTNVFNEFTKANLGSAMTETEWNIYSGMIPQISDTQESLSNKLDTFEDNAVRKLNLYRIENNLPEVTREILLDQTKLTDAYDKMFREQKEKSTPKFVPGGYTITQGYVLNPPPANPSQYQSPAPTSK